VVVVVRDGTQVNTEPQVLPVVSDLRAVVYDGVRTLRYLSNYRGESLYPWVRYPNVVGAVVYDGVRTLRYLSNYRGESLYPWVRYPNGDETL
jgi:hypothetical protein